MFFFSVCNEHNLERSKPILLVTFDRYMPRQIQRICNSRECTSDLSAKFNKLTLESKQTQS